MKHITLKISGKVQGVFFRASTKAKADELGITGFARNDSDGSVHVEAEGDEDVLGLFKTWCHLGPAHARVDHVEILEGIFVGFSDFSIKR